MCFPGSLPTCYRVASGFSYQHQYDREACVISYLRRPRGAISACLCSRTRWRRLLSAEVEARMVITLQTTVSRGDGRARRTIRDEDWTIAVRMVAAADHSRIEGRCRHGGKGGRALTRFLLKGNERRGMGG